MRPKLRFAPGQGLNYPAYTFKTLADVCEIRREIVDLSNLSDVQFAEYSMPAFDSGKKPKVIFGSEAKSGRISICGDVLLFNKLNVRKKRIWNVRNSPDNSVCSAEFIPAIATGVLQDYMYYAVSTDKFTKTVEECSSGTSNSQKRITPSIFLEQKIACPCSQEQQKIASFFTALDEKISIKNATLKSFTALKADTMSRIFSQRLSLGTNGPWKVSLLKDVLDVERGGSPRPIDKFLTSDPDGLNWIKIGDAPIDGNRITSVKEKILRSGLSKTRFVRKGDLILSNSMSFGRPYILDVDGCIHDGWLSIRNSKNVFDVDFLVYLLASQEVKRQYRSLAGAGVVTNLNKDLVNKVILSYPTLREQKNIANILNSIDEKIVIIKKQVATLEKLKEGFMQQMFV